MLSLMDVDLNDLDNAALLVSGDGKSGFSPKAYKERTLPIPRECAEPLTGLSRVPMRVIPTKTGMRETHLPRRLKQIAAAGGVAATTLTTRFLGSGYDIVTV